MDVFENSNYEIKLTQTFKTLDIFKLVFAIVYIMLISIIMYAEVEVNEVLQDWLIILTHAAGAPLIIALWKTQWLAITLLIGIVFSVASHASIIFDWNVDKIEPMDIAFANLTLVLIAIVVIFDKIPEWTIPVLFTLTVLNTIFWDVVWVYSITSGIINLCVAVYVCYRLCVPTPRRNVTFMVIGLLMGICGTVFFLRDGHHSDKNYAILHSVWHICSYGSLYFAVRSIRPDEDVQELRRPRIEFARTLEFGKFAYKD
jgi:hypothetical protein